MRLKFSLNNTFFGISRSIAIILVLLSSMYAFGQNVKWREKVSNRKANFYQVQNDFKQYWSGKTAGKGRGYKVFQRWENYMAPRVFPSGNMALPSTNYVNFISWQRSHPAIAARTNSSLTTGNWTEVGPLSKPTGYDAGVGRVDFIKFNPTNSNIAYVSTPDGGLWKTTNVSAPLPTWTTNTDFLPVIGCSELAIAPDGTTMYLATGSWEADKRSAGILKSTDGGTTWNTTSLTFSAVDNYVIRRLQMDPTNPLIMLAATDGGIFRTTDGWASNSLTSLDGNYNIQDIKFKPTDHNTLYASGKTGLNTSVFYKSTDNGITWAAVNTGLPLSTDVSRVILAVAASNPAYVYVLAGNSDGGYNGLYRSINSGASFTTQSTTPNILNTNIPEDGPGGQANHDLAIAVSPVDANTITIGGISQWRSTDGGVNWNLLTFWYGTDPLNPGGSRPEPYIHADVQTIEYFPGSSTTMFTSSDGGIYRSTDNGVSWTDISNNLRLSQETDVANSATNAGIFITGLQDIGNLKNTNGTFTYIGGGDGESAFIDRTTDLNVVTSDPYGNHRVSTDGGNSFNTLNGNGLPAGTEFFSPIIQDPVTATTCYAGGRPALYKSTNFLSAPSHTWTAIGTPSGTGSVTRFVIYPSNAQIIYTLKEDAVSKTINGGANWTNVTGTLPVGNASIRNITISNTDPNKVWVVFSGYSAGDKVFKTIDGGANWTDVNSTGLPNIPINTIVYRNNSTNDEVYIGADIGVYVIDNTMSAWAPFFTGLARSTVNDLEIFYPTNKLRAATYGRGTWESDLNTPAVNYTITVSAAANGTITPNGPVSVASGANQTFTIAANPCYQRATVLIDGVNNPTAVSTGTYTFTNVTANHTISATFSLLTYVITTNAGANGTITPSGPTTVNCGANQTYTIAPNAGYSIQNVVVDGVSEGAISSRTFTNVTAPHNITATFTQNAFVVTASAGGNGTISPNGPVSVASGANQTFTIAANPCYQRATVLVDGVNNPTAVSTGTYTFTNVTANHTISATFSLLTYVITTNAGANGTITPSGPTTVNCGANQTYTIAPNAGYSIQNVVVDGVSEGAISSRTFTNVTAPHNITATFTQNAFVVTASAGGNGTITPNGPVSVASGANQTFTIAANPCYQRATVLVDGVNNPTAVSTGTYTFTNVTANHTISATFSLLTYVITTNAGANGTITPSGPTTVNCGANQTYTIAPNAGYSIQNVVVDGVSEGAISSRTFTNVTAPHNITATFTQNAFVVTASAGGNGTITPNGPVSVASGANQTFTIAANSCYQRATVLIDGVNNPTAVNTGTYTFTNVTANHTISATFSQLSYVITANAGANGTITPNGPTTVNCGASQTYIIAPNAGYSIQNVVVDGVSEGAISSRTFTNVTAAHTISASFILTANTVVYRINSGGGQVTNSIGTFAADAFFSPAPGNSSSTAAGIAGTTDDAIYQTDRYSSTGILNYAFPVTNGQYTVILHFAEIYFTAVNSRIFDVSLEGTKALDNYDILKKVSANTATTESLPVSVSDGTLNIYFSSLPADGGVNNPKVSAIEIIRTSTNAAPIANAGGDKTITLPVSSTTLNGSGSDVDGMISAYAWTQVSGPNTAIFSNTAAQTPTVSGLIAGNYWFSLVVTDNMMAVSAADLVQVSVNAAGSTPVYRINAGGGEVTNSIGVFAADQYYAPPSSSTSSTAAAIAGTTNDAIYQTDRYSSSKELNYAFPVTNGQYTVILHFAEIYYNANNNRVFDVSLEGTKVLDNYDIFKKVGGNTATTESFPVSVSDGTLNIYFSSLPADGGANNPKVSAIEIIRTSSNVAPVANAGGDKTITLPVSSTTLDGSGSDADGMISAYAWTQVSGPNTAIFSNSAAQAPTVSGLIAGSYWFSLVVTDNQMAASTADLVLVTVNAAGNTPVYRINAGGGEVINSIGVFAADAFYSPASSSTSSTAAPIAGTTNDAIYQTDRFSSSKELNYAFPVTNGQYTVILHFAEIYYAALNNRIFDVSLEGTRVLNNFDIFRKVGANTATTETFPVNVTDGTLNIYFSSLPADGGANNPKVSAIEIIKTGSALTADPPAKYIKTDAIQTDAIQTDVHKLNVKVTPNPAYNHFTFRITSGNNKTLFLRIFNAEGKLIESRTGIAPNGSFQVGSKYRPGLYYAEVLQGTQRVTLKFIKMKN